MKYSDITSKTDKELQTLIDDSRKDLRQALIDMRTKQVKNVKQISALKKTVARALTAETLRRNQKEGTNG